MLGLLGIFFIFYFLFFQVRARMSFGLRLSSGSVKTARTLPPIIVGADIRVHMLVLDCNLAKMC